MSEKGEWGMERQVAQSSRPPDGNSKEDYHKAGAWLEGTARMGSWPVVETEGLWLWHGCDHYADYFHTFQTAAETSGCFP